jgi:hypothetical protein
MFENAVATGGTGLCIAFSSDHSTKTGSGSSSSFRRRIRRLKCQGIISFAWNLTWVLVGTRTVGILLVWRGWYLRDKKGSVHIKSISSSFGLAVLGTLLELTRVCEVIMLQRIRTMKKTTRKDNALNPL